MPNAEPRRRSWLARLLGAVLPIVFLAAGVLVGRHFVETSPKARRQPPPKQARLVEVERITRAPHTVTVRAMGLVGPSREVELAPQVGGRVVWVSDRLTPGTELSEGEEVLRLEAADFELALRQRRADQVRAARDLAVERGQRDVSLQEIEWSGLEPEGNSGDLLRRVPQLQAAEAALDAAEAAVAQAELQVERTTLRAPFASVVREKHVDLGALLSPGSPVASLVGRETAWVEALIPADQVEWLRFPGPDGQEGSVARVGTGATGVQREGRVLRLLPDLDPQGRMARVLVEVPDPFGLDTGQPPLFWGSFVEVELEGRLLPSAARIDRRYLRDGRQLHLVTPENTLEIREVSIVFRGEDAVWVTDGVEDGERLITTDLPVAVPGMDLRLPEPSGAAR